MTVISRAHSLVGYHPEERPEDDFYPTPPKTTEALFKVEKFDGGFWEPACGDGAMARVIAKQGYPVIGTDIFPRDYGRCLDFLASADLLAPNIITNPPFKLLNQFIEHAHSLNPSKFALLSKLQALEGQERTPILERTGLTRVWVFRARQSLYRNGKKMKNGGMIAFAWLVWERGFQGKPELGWI